MGKNYEKFMELTDNGANSIAMARIDEVFEKAFGDDAHWDGLEGLVKEYDNELEAPVCKVRYNKERNMIEFLTKRADEDEDEYGMAWGLLLEKCDALTASTWTLRKLDEFKYYGYKIIIDDESLPTAE